MSHVTEQESAALVGYLSEPGIVPVAWVGTATTDDQLGPEIQGFLLQLLVVDQSGRGIHLVRQTLKVNGGGGDLLPTGGVVAVGEVAPGGEIQTHDAVVRLEHGGVGGEVGRRTRVGLDVDAPSGGIEMEGLEGAGTAQVLNLVDELVAAVVAVAGHALGVLVGEGTPQRLYDGEGSEVLRRYQLYSPTLPTLLLLNQVVDFWVHRRQRRVTPRAHSFHPLPLFYL